MKNPKLSHYLIFFLLCIILGCPAAKSKTQGQSDQKDSPYNVAMPIEKILEDFDAELDVSKTLKAYGSFANPTKDNTNDKLVNIQGTLVRVVGINGEYTVRKETERVMNLGSIYGFENLEAFKDHVLHAHYFYAYKEDIKSPMIKGSLISSKNPSTNTVIVHGKIEFWHLNTETNVEKELNVYFGNNYKNGNNGGVVFDENNIAISGIFSIESSIYLDNVDFENYYKQDNRDFYKRQYDIEKLTDIEKAELKKLNFFDIAP